jgi:hypothetical protein
MIICWFTPKSLDGSSEKFEIARFGFWSQSDSDSKGEVENDAKDGGRPRLAFSSRLDVERSDFVD